MEIGGRDLRFIAAQQSRNKFYKKGKERFRVAVGERVLRAIRLDVALYDQSAG